MDKRIPRGNLVKENPEYVMWLHRRLGAWVIDVHIKQLNRTVEVHQETSRQRAIGVFSYLDGNPPLMMREAKQLIQQIYYPNGLPITIEEELARR